MSLSLSQLQAPVSNAFINDYAEKVQLDVVALCQKLGIWQPHIDEYNTMSAYLFPYAGEKQLLTIGLYNNLLYYVDDTYDRHKQEHQLDEFELYSIFKDASIIFSTGFQPTVINPVTTTIYHLHYLLREVAPSHRWFERFVGDTLDHLISSLDGVNTELPIPFSSWFEYYLEIRDLDSGMSPTIDLIELALGYEIPESIYRNELIKEAHLQVSRYCSLSNDIFSYDKEVMRYGSDFNAVVMLQRDGYSLDDAVAHLIQELNAMVARFRELYAAARSEKLATVMPDDALRYMDCLWYQIVAAYHWQFDTNRYRSLDATFVELRNFLPTDAVA